MFLFKSNVYHPGVKSLLKLGFLILLKGINFCGVLSCGFLILRELIFADRGQSAKSAKLEPPNFHATRKQFIYSAGRTENTEEKFKDTVVLPCFRLFHHRTLKRNCIKPSRPARKYEEPQCKSFLNITLGIPLERWACT